MNKETWLVTTLTVGVCLAIIGCSPDDPTGPAGGVPGLGTLVLEAEVTEFEIVGAKTTIVSTLTNADGVIIVSPQVSFTSSNPSVVQVGADGVVTALWPGTAQMQASAGGVDASLDFTVTISGPEGPPILGSVVPCAGGMAGPFPCDSMDLLSYMPHAGLGVRGGRLTDIWGWTDPLTGKEYALVGQDGGLTFVDVSDPLRPRAVGVLPSTGRDVKVYKNNAFVIGGETGVQIFDLKVLRFANSFTTFLAHGRYTELSNGHNIAINEATGFAYVVGGNTCRGGLHMIDVSSPPNPSFAGCYTDAGWIHDVQCILYDGPDTDYSGREICVGLSGSFLSVIDVTDKASPAAVATATYAGAQYAHQGWFTEDRRYFIQNDELDNNYSATSRTLIWDMADLDNPIMVHEYFGPTSATDHNLYVHGSRAYLSNYTAGLRVLDIADPLTPVEIAFFDTHPADDDPGFRDGSWSNYPFFESGITILSSMHEGLFVVRLQP